MSLAMRKAKECRIVNDVKGKKDDDKTSKESKKDETNSRNIFSWEKYPQLCKLLFNN